MDSYPRRGEGMSPSRAVSSPTLFATISVAWMRGKGSLSGAFFRPRKPLKHKGLAAPERVCENPRYENRLCPRVHG